MPVTRGQRKRSGLIPGRGLRHRFMLTRRRSLSAQIHGVPLQLVIAAILGVDIEVLLSGVASLQTVYQRGDGLSHQAAFILQIIVDLASSRLKTSLTYEFPREVRPGKRIVYSANSGEKSA